MKLGNLIVAGCQGSDRSALVSPR